MAGTTSRTPSRSSWRGVLFGALAGHVAHPLHTPAVLQRIQALGELAHEVSAVDLEPPVLQQRLAEVAAGSGGWSRAGRTNEAVAHYRRIEHLL
ncbi:MAG: hypothetical protein M3Q39_06395 [Actinomycetota bacterium]|nr:hypothetical protein [Actinomycetota bacterium]